jgi:DNA-binding CsgD family transcriptional regulator
LLRHSPARVAHARALLDLGRVRREAGDADGAREALHEALDLADRCDAAGLVGQGLGELRACGERPRRAARTGIRALTPAERRAAELAAGGDTNSVIAGTLVVSLKTVEGHLHNAYRKLGVESREQLRAALAPVDYHR